MTKYLQTETDAIYQAYLAYEEALSRLQEQCTHPTILENGYEDGRRICEDCGLEETSRWLSPYNWYALKGRVYKVEWTEFAQARPLQTYIREKWRASHEAVCTD